MITLVTPASRSAAIDARAFSCADRDPAGTALRARSTPRLQELREACEAFVERPGASS